MPKVCPSEAGAPLGLGVRSSQGLGFRIQLGFRGQDLRFRALHMGCSRLRVSSAYWIELSRISPYVVKYTSLHEDAAGV